MPKRKLATKNSPPRASESFTYFSSPLRKVANTTSSMTESQDTEGERRRQRRFDSLARVLSLCSTNSACAAVTLFEGELIIAANCAEKQDPIMIYQLLSQKLTSLRTILKGYQKKPYHSLQNIQDAKDYFARDIRALKKCGGFLHAENDIAQALHKLVKSVASQDDSSQETAFTDEEITVLLDLDNITILVAGEESQEPSNQQNELSFEHIDSIWSSPATTGSVTNTSIFTETTDSDTTSNAISPVSNALSFANSREKNMSTTTVDTYSSTSSNNLSSTNKPIKNRGFLSFWDAINACSDSSSSDNDQEITYDSNAIEPIEDYIMTSLKQSFESKANLFNSSVNEGEFDIHYVMNVYPQTKCEPIPFPDSIYKTKNRPRSVASFHAEQLIAFYLQKVKEVDLNDQTAPAIHFGISKLCCAACAILYRYERIEVRGVSDNHFDNVPIILSNHGGDYSSDDLTTPKFVRNKSVATPSPWSK